jgi:hypothetical protein
MAYIEAHQSLFTHRKTLRLGRLLGMDRFCVVGRLIALWCWALDNAPDGVVAVADSDILADVMGWQSDREPAELCEALVAAGFFEHAAADDGTVTGTASSSGFYVLHDWYQYAGKLIEKRKSDAERKRRERSGTGRAMERGAAYSDSRRAVRCEWKAMARLVRDYLLERDGWSCQMCGVRQGPFEIDHIVPVARGGQNVPDNLRVLCRTGGNRRKGVS